MMSDAKVHNLFKLLHCLNGQALNDDIIEKGDLNKIYTKLFDEISPQIHFNEALCIQILQSDIPIKQIPFTYNGHWKYICLNFRFLNLLEDVFKQSEVLSVRNTKVLGLALKGLNTIGIACNLRPSLPYYVDIPSLKPEQTTEGALSQYNLLKLTTSKLLQYLNIPVLRPLILENCLSYIIVAVFQLAKCPLIKPHKNVDKAKGGFVMTEELYNLFMEDHQRFTLSIHNLQKHIYRPMFIKEVIILFRASNAPGWFTREVSTLLVHTILTQEKGLQDMASVIVDGNEYDSALSWKGVDVFTRIIVQLLKSPKNQHIICEQLFMYMTSCFPEDGKCSKLPIRLFTECTKAMYNNNRELCEQIFLPKIYQNLSKFADPKYELDELVDLTTVIAREVRLIHGCFVTCSPSAVSSKLPLFRITPYILILFRMYQEMVVPLTTEIVVSDLREILQALLRNSTDNINLVFDALLFNIIDKSILPFREDICFQLQSNNRITVNKTVQTIKYTVRLSANILNQLIQEDEKLIKKLFGYYINCITNKNKYFPSLSNIELLSSEEEYMNVQDSAIFIHGEVSRMSETPLITDHLENKTCGILDILKSLLVRAIGTKILKSTDFEHSDFQNVFVVMMILQSMKESSTQWTQDLELNKLLQTIHDETVNEELKSLTSALITSDAVEGSNIEEDDSEYSRALVDACDVMVPVKGHGLMVLAKLVENKDNKAIQNKNYLLAIFQQNLNNSDSYIYLSAVRGLAALGNAFTDTVLQVLCEEFSCFEKEFKEGNSTETRMKLGEVLVNITKELGEMAPKYKALLINTFLNAAKDDDNLIRASSLSNLGDLCKVLGYKLGSILFEVLACVSGVIIGDSAVEPRRAAVTVLRQLFQGLGPRVIALFKDEVLPVYRLLKHLYQNDKDEVVRLQAQLALEELNAVMYESLLPILPLHPEKNIIHMT